MSKIEERYNYMEIQPSLNKLQSAIKLLEEKLCDEHNLELEELRKTTIIIKNGKITVKGKK